MKTIVKVALSAVMLSTIGTLNVQAEDAPVTAMALKELSQYQVQESQVTDRLKKFDTLDFEVFSGQHWDRLKESHSKDILVHWPDGHTTKGIDVHINDLKAFFVYAPDTRIEQHPVRIGQGDWTGVVGVIEGTFTKPMPIGDGKFIQPTNKPYKLTMATIGHWNDDGVMDEEYLFWDNLTFMKQIGLAK